VEERASAAGRRVVAAASVATARPVEAARLLASISAAIEPGDPSRVYVEWPGGAAAIAFRGAEPGTLSIRGLIVRGPRLRLVRVDEDGASVAGESIASIDSVASFDRPGSVRIANVDGATEVTASCGVRVDEGWSRSRLTAVATRRAAGPWVHEAELVEPGVVPNRLVQRLRRRFGTRLVDIRLSARP
jgi:hypothetical protein